jgi:hypothetical protein
MTNKLHPGVKDDTLINAGALKMALNVLRRAGKGEVADELEKTAMPVSSLPADEAQYYQNQAEQTLKMEQLQSRWKHANAMSMSYMAEFEKRGLVYTPLLPVETDSFK